MFKFLRPFLVAFTPTFGLVHNQFMPSEMQVHAGLGHLFPLNWMQEKKKEGEKRK